MKVLITGAKGFIGKNLSLYLKNHEIDVLEIDKDNLSDLKLFILKADFIIHLAGVNRPLDDEEFYNGNVNSLVEICNVLKKNHLKTPILLASSVQALLDNPYGKSKRQAELYLEKFHKENRSPIYIYRFDNVFGKWAKPNYNSVVATFCYNVSHNLEIKVNDASTTKTFIYIDDINENIYRLLSKNNFKGSNKYLKIHPSYKLEIGKLAEIIKSFKDGRNNLYIADSKDGIVKKLYSTYLSYLDEDDFSYKIITHKDERGSFSELFKSKNAGQVSVNIIKKGITKGNHYHHSKNEKFVVVSGECLIKFRKIGDDKVISYLANEDEIKVIDIPTGYTHNITNIGNKDAVVIMWANESFDVNKPDTIYEEV